MAESESSYEEHFSNGAKLMSDLIQCPVCMLRFWAQDGHSCRYGSHASIPPKPMPFTVAPASLEDIRRVVREELERASLGKGDGQCVG